MSQALARKALEALDVALVQAETAPVTLAVGGGGSMILQYDFAGSTTDIDAVPTNMNFEDLKPFIKQVSEELGVAPDWLNPYYGTFTVYLSEGAQTRMRLTFSGKKLTVKTLSPEDVLVMKFMANRSKDIPHIRHLLRQGVKIDDVEERLIELVELFPKVAKSALDLFYEETEDL